MPLLVSLTQRGSILDRLKQVLSRAENLEPLVEPSRKLLWEANRDRAEKGLDYTGAPYAPLKASTLADRAKHYYPPGPPLNRRGSSAAVITGCEVRVAIERGRLRFSKSWPNVPWIKYAIAGNAKMAPRDPMGWNPDEMLRLRALVPPHVLGRR